MSSATRRRNNEIVRFAMDCDRRELRYLLVEVVRELLRRGGSTLPEVERLAHRAGAEDVPALDLVDGS